MPPMNLTVALVLLAVALLVLLLGQWWWAGRRARVRRPALPAAARVEPPLGHSTEVAPGGPTEPTGDPAEPPELRAIMVRRAGRLDALVDAIAPLTLEAPVAGDAAVAHMPASRRAGSKPFTIEGLNTETAEWELPAAGQRYGEFQAGVQLANRSGALNEIEYSEFVQKVQAFADAMGALPDFPDMLDVVGRARELDAFAAPHDAQLDVILRANSVAWSVGYVQQSASRHGFVPGAVPGRLVLPATEAGAPPVLVIHFDPQAALQDDPNLSALREVTLSLDVAQTAETAEPFAAWQQAARGLADDMDASLLDNNGQPVTLQAFAAIHHELQRLYRALADRGLPAGSPATRRLFS